MAWLRFLSATHLVLLSTIDYGASAAAVAATLETPAHFGAMAPRAPSVQPRELFEIDAAHVEHAASELHPRAATAQADLALQERQSWYWGGDNPVGAVNNATTANPLVNLTGIADTTERFLSMERFTGAMAITECADGTIRFTLLNADSFQAVQDWIWVSESDRSVVIVLSPGTCGNERRQPYRASEVSFNAEALTATCSADTTAWANALKYHSKFGLNTQGILPGAVDAAPGNLNKRITIPIKRNDALNLATDFSGKELFSKGPAKISCTDCSTRGSLHIDIDIEMCIFCTTFGTITVTPDGIGSTTIPDFALEGIVEDVLSASVSLPVIGLAGLHILGVVDIGPEVRVSAEAAIDSVSASADISMGAKLDIPQDSIVKIDIADGTKNEFKGWVPTFTPVASNLAGEVSVHDHVGPRVNLELSILILSTGLAAGVSLGAPQLTLDLKAASSTAGDICDDESVDVGASVDVGLGAELDAFGELGNPEDLHGKLALFSTSDSLFSTCFPIAATATGAASPAGVTGTTTTFLNGNCDASQSGSNQLSEGVCTPAGANSDFQSGSVTFAPLDQGAGCILQYFSDSNCATSVGSAFNPSSGQCITAEQIGAGAETIRFVKVSNCS